jgi:uncharacterized membrane protein YeaQ/YmgE (transglycosylase-associated protein family)
MIFRYPLAHGRIASRTDGLAPGLNRNPSAPVIPAISRRKWIILGLTAGFIASKIVNKQGEGFFLDIVLGIVGALVGGFIFSAVGARGITRFNLYSLVRHRSDRRTGRLSRCS